VQLDRVDVVDAEAVERAPDLLARGGVAALAGLRRDEELALVLPQPVRDAQLGVAVSGGGVDVVDAVLEQQLESAVGVALGPAGERRGAEDHAGGLVAGGSEGGALDHDPEVTPRASLRRPERNGSRSSTAWA
jgi:hypothetical protein